MYRFRIVAEKRQRSRSLRFLITHGCRELNLWRPPRWIVDKHAEEPKIFLENLAYILDSDGTAIEQVLNFLTHLGFPFKK